NRRGQYSLLQKLLHAFRLQESEYVVEREAMLLAERNIQSVVGRRRLQLEIERPAEPLSQRQPPCLVDSPAERGVDHELHAAALVEKSLRDDRLLRWHGPKNGASRDQILDSLLGAGLIESAFLLQPIDGRRRACIAAHLARQKPLCQRVDFRPDLRNWLGKLRRARWRFSPPKWTVRR